MNYHKNRKNLYMLWSMGFD